MQLSETKEQIQLLVNKVQVLDFVISGLNHNHIDYKDRIEEQYKQASHHKLKLTEEILRLNGAEKVEVIKPTLQSFDHSDLV